MVIVAAVGRNGVIGIEGRLPWRIPEDMAHFKRLTLDHALVMGRATFDSIGRPLPGRLNIVLTRRREWAPEGVTIAASLEEAMDLASAHGGDTIIVGGAEVYRLALPLTDRMELTEVEAEPEGDTYFPTVEWAEWNETAREPHNGFSFVTYERRGGSAPGE